jgi:serine/threonine-protein kinase RsbW
LKPPDESVLTWLRLPGMRAALAQFKAFVLGFAQRQGLPEALQLKIDLVLEEVLLNIFDNAFESAPAGAVAVGCGIDPGKGFWVRVTDPGRAFDPLGQPPPDTTRDIADREVGGLGIHLARQMSSHMHYQRRNGQNVLDFYFLL